VAALPGVAAVADAAYQPFAGDYWTSVFAIAGRDRVAYGAEPYNQEIGRGYFRTVGLPLRRGRAFTTADHAAAPRVIIVNETLARRHFPDQDPLGQRLALDREPDADSLWYTIVGVVADSRLDGFAKPVPPAIYHPLTQEFRRERFLLVRSQIDAAGLVGEIRELVSSVDPSLPLMRVVTIPEVMAGSLARERFLMVLLGVFAAVALVLAAIGTYGVMAAAVNERVPEIAVRMALGATAGGVVRQVMAEGMRKVLVGFAVGLGAAWLLRRSLEALLFEIRAVDPGTTAVASAVLLGTGFLACYLPTRRASRVDPTTALRCE
ncbi:MAG: FtsX-like permease family protein, partial [bacterium]|nr:FtsX-like permease family protein [bacterium]